mmetsp:Transcript_8771/g.11579  ORF Transcript_8771/g.11579 Transcript_8771/m.11579 type:complete len:475 (+) Transcript_8771:35-1459(+)
MMGTTLRNYVKWCIFALVAGVLVAGAERGRRRKKFKDALNLLMQGPSPLSSTRQGKRAAEEEQEDVRFLRRKRWFEAHWARCGLAEALVKVVHVAGTNGKGTVCELVRACAVANGKRVGTFTSPHIHCVRERIRVNERLIPRQDFARLSLSLEEEFQRQPWMLFFDRLLAVAIAFFAERYVEYIILEVGIGGRFDSTNFVEFPSCVAITNIGLDHQNLLGNTLRDIAWQKAGIIKPNRKAFTTAEQKSEVLEVLQNQALSKKTTLDIVKNDRYQHIPCSLAGIGQQENLQVAVAVTQHLHLQPVGMDQAFWPCRFETFIVDDKQTVVIDGAHNISAAQKLFAEVQLRFKGQKVACVFGALRDKNVEEMLSYICRYSIKLVLAKAASPRGLCPTELTHMLPPADVHNLAELVETDCPMTVCSATKYLLDQKSSDDGSSVLVICGSLTVAAEARKCISCRYPELFNSDDWVFEEED